MKTSVRRGHRWSVRCLMALAAALTQAQAGGGVLNLQKAVPYKPGIEVSPAVRVECELPKKLAAYTQAAAEDDYGTVNMLESPVTNAPGRTLIMQIVGVDALAGGNFSGRKGVNIEGKLWEGGKIIGSFQATRYSSGGGGGFSRFKGTCKILARDVKTLGKDVAEWLASPSMNARLGEAR